jgi:hypothetical protein
VWLQKTHAKFYTSKLNGGRGEKEKEKGKGFAKLYWLLHFQSQSKEEGGRIGTLQPVNLLNCF